MSYVQALCSKCDKVVEVDKNEEAWVCPHCSSPFVVEKGIRRFNAQQKDVAKKVKAADKEIADFEIDGNILVRYKGDSAEVAIPESITKIGENAFENNENIEMLILHDSLREIGGYAFRGCKKLREIRLPDSITNIGEWAFRECESLKSVMLPPQLRKIADSLFADCASLEKVDIGDNVAEIGIFAFSGCKSLVQIELPKNLAAIGKYAFSGCEKLEKMTISDNVSLIEDHTFAECKALSDVTLPKALKGIGQFAFKDCISLRFVQLPPGVLSVDGFSGCSGLRAMEIPAKCETIGDFSGCTSLETIRIPATVKSINGGFDNCPKLLSINWPNLSGFMKFFPAYYEQEVDKRKKLGVCIYCGGEFKLIGKTCKVCGKKKDY